MKNKIKKTFIPSGREETIRQEIIGAIERETLSAKDISGIVRISEKEVYEHLHHIQISINKKERSLVVTPAECRKCGFSFKKREKLRKPGKCPSCRSELIRAPLFLIK